MSAELPQLERLIADAAERHYGRRRLRVRAPRLSLVAGFAAAAAAIALAIVILPIRSDERSASPPSDPAAELAPTFSVFASEPARSRLEAEAVQDQRLVLDLRKPVSTRLLRQHDGQGVVVVIGTTTTKPGKAVCLWERTKRGGGSSCAEASTLVAGRPWFVYGGIGRTPNEIRALVPDDVITLQAELKNGKTREVPVAKNLAYVTTDQPICWVNWTTADGKTGRERGPTRAEEATPDEPKPATCG
jgi:hypothetical protein